MGNKSKFYANIEAMHSEVTGSCILTSVTFPNGEKLRFIVDCGLYQEREYEQLNGNLNLNAENIDFVLVTHNHVDHTGRLPLLVKKGYDIIQSRANLQERETRACTKWRVSANS